jgi:cyclopropane fatty-acyl-phospholipid synthase-like methyltransferase
MMAYLSSKALFTALELGVFDSLDRDGPGTAEEVGARIGLPERPARVLMLALLGEQLVRRDGGRYRNDPAATTYLVRTNPQYVGALVEHQVAHYNKFARLTEALRNDRALHVGENYSTAFGADEAWARRMAEATRGTYILMAEDLASMVRLDGHRHMVDLGCASCVYSIGFVRTHPDLHITAVDSAPVAAVGAHNVAASGLSDRITVQPGDIFTDRYPECDAALLSNVLQGFDRERAGRLIAHICDWLPVGGELVLHTHLPERATAPFPYQFGMILVVNNTQGGEAHDEEITRRWCTEAGFRDVQIQVVSPISSVVRATK